MMSNLCKPGNLSPVIVSVPSKLLLGFFFWDNGNACQNKAYPKPYKLVIFMNNIQKTLIKKLQFYD